MAPYYLNAKDVQVKWKDHEITMRRCGKFRREWETAETKTKIGLRKTIHFYVMPTYY